MRSFYTILICSLLFLAIIVSISYSQVPWTKDANNPIMSGSGDPTWDKHVVVPCVLYNADSARYEMWFSASLTGGNPMRIGYAVSADGISWTRHANPVLEPDMGTWDESTVRGARIIRENGSYKMWYVAWSPSNTAGGLGYATSPNGIDWTKDDNNPIIIPGAAAWQAGGHDWFCILPVEGEGYKLWFTGYNAEVTTSGIGLATSEDGLVWQADTINNPVLTMGAANQWDRYKYNPHVLFLDGTYHMWYEADKNPNLRSMGWATSTDGINWNRYNDPSTTEALYVDSDPVLQPTPGQWDENYIEPGTVMLDGDMLRLWYSSYYTNLWKIGHASSIFERSSPLAEFSSSNEAGAEFRFTEKCTGIVTAWLWDFDDSHTSSIRNPTHTYESPGIYNVVLIATGPYGADTISYEIITALNDKNERLPGQTILYNNYPNPFNPKTMINYQLSMNSDVDLSIYNLLGQKVATLVSKKQIAGDYAVQWDASNFASGVYLYKLHAGNFIKTKKMVLMK